MYKLLITHMEIQQTSCIVTAFVQDGQIVELRFGQNGKKSILGNIYVGYVENVAAHIQAAFIRIQENLTCSMGGPDR